MTYQFIDSVADYPLVKSIWNRLISDGAKHSFFLSWIWMGTWINALRKENISVIMVVISDGSRPIAAFFIGKKAFSRHWVIPVKSLTINTVNMSYYDNICIEYNSLLIAPGHSINYESLFDALNGFYLWDEIHIPSIEGSTFELISRGLNQVRDLNIINYHKAPSYYVELEKIRSNRLDYLDLLSKNRKKQLKSSINAYRKIGEITTRLATTAEEALFMLKELSKLSQKKWDIKNEPGAFSNDFLVCFHEKLIKDNFEKKCIQLLQVSCNEDPIGYLYNFTYFGKVYFYQSGFQYRKENKYRPGMVSHYFSILLNAENGFKIYDFLEGEANYKKSMATNKSELYWLTIQKKHLRFKLEQKLKKTLIALKKLTRS